MTVQKMRNLAIARGGMYFEQKSQGHRIWWVWLNVEGSKVLDLIDPEAVLNIDDVALLDQRVENALRKMLDQLEPPTTVSISMGD